MEHAIEIHVEDGQFTAFVVNPASTPAPAVIVLHEVFGVNNDIRQTCRELADAGFIAIAPELFWRQERGADLNNWSPEDWAKGLALNAAYDRNLGVQDIDAVVHAARQLDGANGKVGVMGFCIGGLMTYLVSVRCEVDAAVAYHGGDTDHYLDEASSLKAPLLMHLAAEDEYINKDSQMHIKAALANVPATQVVTYAGQKHAFARHTGHHYNAEAAASAQTRTLDFFKSHLSMLVGQN